MNSGKITTKLIDLARVLTGWMPGELSHVNVAVSMLFAGISGSSTADAAGCGKILIPAMVKEGYDRRFAIAITACSSVMGVIIPPSILMVVWGGVMQMSVGALFLAGAITNTTAAGDSFNGAYIAALLDGRSTSDAIGIAQRCAGRVIQSKGALMTVSKLAIGKL